MARAGALLLLVVALTAAVVTACPDACACFRDARLWLSLPREESLTARCTRRGLDALPEGLGDVRHLDVSGNRLVQLRQDELLEAGLRHLLSVDLSANSIEEVEVDAFRGLHELRRVSLAHNHLATLPQDLFADTPHLWFLSLAGNPLVVPEARALLVAPSLTVLDVSDCKLSAFPDGILGSDNSLQELIAATNSFAEAQVDELRHLRRLDISDNRVRRVSEEDLRAASDLRSLIVDGNPLRVGDHPLASSESLRSLSAVRCGLHHIQRSALEGLPLLQELSLNGNGLWQLDGDLFSGLPLLERLNLRDNRLSRLPKGMFSENSVLRALDLSHNHLDVSQFVHSVSSEVEPVSDEKAVAPWLESRSLRELSLSHCGLQTLPPQMFSGVPSLRNLSLSSNALRTAGAQLMESLPRLRALDLSENPLHCDASLRSLWLSVNLHHVRATATCVEPPGDWQMLRFMAPAQNATATQQQTAQSVTARAAADDEEEGGLADALAENGLRWGPPVGLFLLAVVFVFGLRKCINRQSVKHHYYTSRSKEYVYESEEDDSATMTFTTLAGTPRNTPTSALSAGPVSPAAAQRLAGAGSRFAVSFVGEKEPLAISAPCHSVV